MSARSSPLVVGTLTAALLAACSVAPAPVPLQPPVPASVSSIPPPIPTATPTNHLDETWAPVTDPESGVTMDLPGPTTVKPITKDGASGLFYSTSNARGPALGFLVLRLPEGYAADLDGGLARQRASLTGPVLSDVTSTINGHPTHEQFIGRGNETPATATKVVGTPTHQIIVNVVGPDQNVVEALYKRAYASLKVPAAQGPS